MTHAQLSESYLELARNAGALVEAAAGRYVLGAYPDPVTGEIRGLVEYCDEKVYHDLQAVDAMLAAVAGACPAAVDVLVRAPSTIILPAPWQVYLTYVRFAGTPDQLDPDDVWICEAEQLHQDIVAGWLARAISAGCEEHQESVDVGAGPLDAARRILTTPGRRSYVAAIDGRIVGHATLLCEAHDDPTGRHFVELVDVLVEGVDDSRRVMAALVAECARHAAALQRPLIGHVVHPLGKAEAGKGERILAGLRRQGWSVDHVFWRRPLDDRSAAGCSTSATGGRR